MSNFFFSEDDVDFASVKICIQEACHLRHISGLHGAEGRNLEFSIDLMHLDEARHRDLGGQGGEANLNKLLWVEVTMPVQGAREGCGDRGT